MPTSSECWDSKGMLPWREQETLLPASAQNPPPKCSFQHALAHALSLGYTSQPISALEQGEGDLRHPIPSQDPVWGSPAQCWRCIQQRAQPGIRKAEGAKHSCTHGQCTAPYSCSRSPCRMHHCSLPQFTSTSAMKLSWQCHREVEKSWSGNDHPHFFS